MKENYLVVEAVGMWESRRDFQRVWEGWEAGSLAFHAFHTLSFPWPAFRMGDAGFTATSTSAMGRTRKEVFVVIVVDACIGDYASVGAALMRSAFPGTLPGVSQILISRLDTAYTALLSYVCHAYS